MNTQVDINTLTRLRLPQGDASMQQMRQQAMDWFTQNGLPRADEEEWRFTNTDPIAEINWTLPGGSYDAAGLYQEHSLKKDCGIELVFVNGVFARELSSLSPMPKGLTAGLQTQAPEASVRKLATLATVNKTPFVALNTGFMDQVMVIHAARGAMIAKPVHILHLSTTQGAPLLFSPRILIDAEAGAVLSVIETHAGNASDAVLSNAVTEVFIAPDANVEHYQTYGLSEASWAINNTIATIAADAKYTHHGVSYNGKMVRNDLEVILDGPHGEATLNGLVLARGNRHVDNHTLIRHEKPDCASHELYKHVVDDKAFGVFKGRIFVQKDAQHTDAKQTNRTLLLSDKAMMESMPALEIYADDVKCTNGSTTGPLDEDMLFYLRSRGLSTASARDLLIYAFAAAMTQRMKVWAVRRKIESYLAAQQGLPQDLSIEAT